MSARLEVGPEGLLLCQEGVEVLRVTAAGEVTARADDGSMVPITLAPHRVEALRGTAGAPSWVAILAAELAERELAGRRR